MGEFLITIFFWLLITPLHFSIAKHCEFTSNHRVHVINKLPSHSQKLNDDLGYHNLTTNQDFIWLFCESILYRTLFFCHFWWGSKEKAFDVF
ncbi:hypothetical protein P3S67_002092 [Capsicum chacoense]